MSSRPSDPINAKGSPRDSLEEGSSPASKSTKNQNIRIILYVYKKYYRIIFYNVHVCRLFSCVGKRNIRR